MKTNNHTAHLKQWGFLDVVSKIGNTSDNDYPYQCKLPPENECQEDQFTVVFMAYNPDRLRKMMNQIKTLLTEFSKIVAEVVIVWNGSRTVEETTVGRQLIIMCSKLQVRISYPLKSGFPNDLLNRYHPRLNIKTKAIMYYDDDGPFYSYKAILGGFELWKRNSNAQIGAMARKLDLNRRQSDESNSILSNTLGGGGNDGKQQRPPDHDRYFVSHCATDSLHYNYNTFTNFHARMVLPSGSFLHSTICVLYGTQYLKKYDHMFAIIQ